jgi:cob(I)alamin adenosyltransferase
MVVLNKIYTRTGDDGTTALGSGERIRKDSLRVSAYGTVDETNAAIGMARVHLAAAASAAGSIAASMGDNAVDVDAVLGRIQNDLFDLGADLCLPDRGKPLPYEPLRIVPEQVARLEREIDGMNATLKPLRSFVLPGGTPGAAALHVARTVSRRAERLLVQLAAEPDEPVSAAAIRYLNRLSDLLFVASRYVNDRGGGDVLWVPGQNRDGGAAKG